MCLFNVYCVMVCGLFLLLLLCVSCNVFVCGVCGILCDAIWCAVLVCVIVVCSCVSSFMCSWVLFVNYCAVMYGLVLCV